MVAALLDAGGFDPTVINGGIINAYGTNARLGTGEWMVVEADESDGTFLKLPANVAIVTNIDPEHLDHFKTFDAVQDAFRAFVENVPFYGFSVMCTDHPVVQSLVGRIEDRRIVTYGENPQADVRLVDVSHAGGTSLFTIVFRDRAGSSLHEIKNVALPMPGRHNALNATAAIAVAHELGVGDDVIRNALANFGGVRRRFTRTGMWNGVTIVDDYGHHPVEIAAVLQGGARIHQGPGHRRGAAASLYAAAALVRAVLHLLQRCRHGDRRAGLFGRRSADRGRRSRFPGAGPAQTRASPGFCAGQPGPAASLVASMAKPGDYVVCLGAGSITQWAYALPGELAAVRPDRMRHGKNCLAVRHVAFEDLGLFGPLVCRARL